MSENFWYKCLDCTPADDATTDSDTYRTESVKRGDDDMKLILQNWDRIALPIRAFRQEVEALGASVQVGIKLDPRYSGDYFYEFLEEHLGQGHTVALVGEYNSDVPIMTHKEKDIESAT